MLGKPFEQEADAFRSSEVLADPRLEASAFFRLCPAAPIAQPEPGADDHDVAGILTVAQSLPADIAGFIQATNAQFAQQFEEAPFVSGQDSSLNDYLERHG